MFAITQTTHSIHQWTKQAAGDRLLTRQTAAAHPTYATGGNQRQATLTRTCSLEAAVERSSFRDPSAAGCSRFKELHNFSIAFNVH